MAEQYLTVTKCDGLLRDDQLLVGLGQGGLNPPGSTFMITLENFRATPNDIDRGSYTPLRDPTVGMMLKSPTILTFANTVPVSTRARGIFVVESNDASDDFVFFQSVSARTSMNVYYYDYSATTWHTLTTGLDAYHTDGETFGDKYFFASGTNYLRKWWHGATDWESVLPIAKDKKGTAVAIAAATLTWNLTTSVTSDIDVSASVAEGDWIRKSSSSAYWDEVKTIDGAGTTITLMSASSDTGASAAGGAQKAPDLGYKPLFVKRFKGKLWLACDLDDADYYSRLYWSKSGDPEDWSGTEAGFIDVGTTYHTIKEGKITGLGVLGDLLFVFKMHTYYVYRWTGSVTTPIELVRQETYGCHSERTIQEGRNGLFYLSSSGLRWTNGNQDKDVSRRIRQQIKTRWTDIATGEGSDFFSISSTDDYYPWARIDYKENRYYLYLPNPAGNTVVYPYDFETGKFLGTDFYYDAGCGTAPNRANTCVFGTAQASINAYYYSEDRTDATTAGILESPTFYSGVPTKKIKIHWVEFGFNPQMQADVTTTIQFNYRCNLDALVAGNALTHNLIYTLTSPPEKFYVERKRFKVDKICNYFSWYLTETAFDGTEDWGLADYTICYEIMSTT